MRENIFKNVPFLLHGTFICCDGRPSVCVGDTMRGRGEQYVEDWASLGPIYERLEELRPEDCIAHKDAVFMSPDRHDMAISGGPSEECILVVQPVGDVHRHDISWLIRAREISNDEDMDENERQVDIDDCIHSYWSGEAYEGIYEYLAKEVVVKEELYPNTDEERLSFLERSVTIAECEPQEYNSQGPSPF